MLRLVLAAALVAASALPNLPAAAQQGKKPAGKPAAAQPPPPPQITACRTAEEICFLGLVTKNQVLVLFTNTQNAQGIEEKPIDVKGADNQTLDLAAHDGRVVLLTGAYDPKAGLTKAEVVEVASPLVSLILKAQMFGAQDADPPQGAAQKPVRR